jgi:hypothetical protein
VVIDYPALRATAVVASRDGFRYRPGASVRWFVNPDRTLSVAWSPTIDGKDTCVPQSYADGFDRRDVEFMAAANPSVVLALLDEIDRLRGPWCEGCGNPIDPEVCMCGALERDHTILTDPPHSVVPTGCGCHGEIDWKRVAEARLLRLRLLDVRGRVEKAFLAGHEHAKETAYIDEPNTARLEARIVWDDDNVGSAAWEHAR